MEFVFHPQALAEFKAEIVWYETKQDGLGAAFADDVLRTIDLLCLFPRIGSPEEAGVRTMMTKRFPFLIYYEVQEHKLWIWAVMHASREPGYWKSRQTT
ncbi:MAG: type II toxin-antitoxin system RelE/ParE family toxin [Verrucomicrobiia bacterium]|jgi:plasmid stabilization system protein ParE